MFYDPNGLLTLSVKFGGGLGSGPFGGTAETGGGIDSSGQLCLVTTKCGTDFFVGPGFAEIGASLELSKGEFCEDRVERDEQVKADIGFGGVGSVSASLGNDGKLKSVGKAFGGLGAGVGGGTMMCETRTFCIDVF